MSPPRPANTPWLLPYITVVDVDKAVKFYESAFKFNVVNLVPGEDGTSWHAEMKYKDQLLMCGKQGCYGSTKNLLLPAELNVPLRFTSIVKMLISFIKKLSPKEPSLLQNQKICFGEIVCVA